MAKNLKREHTIDIEDRIIEHAIGKDPGKEISKVAKSLIGASIAENTKRAYQRDLARYVSWARRNQTLPFPASPNEVCDYLGELVDQGYKAATIDRAVCSLAFGHAILGYPDPTKHDAVRLLKRGYRRTIGTGRAKASPLTLAHLLRVFAVMDKEPRTPRVMRDRALFAIGWAGALRRSELVSIQYNDLRWVAEGLAITIPRSKTDQLAQGTQIGIPFGQLFCPVTILRDFLTAAKIESGPIFTRIRNDWTVGNQLTDRSLNNIVKKWVEKAGYDHHGFSGHSLRAGLITTAAGARLNDVEVMRHSRHMSHSVYSGYVRPATLFISNPLSMLLACDD